MKSFEINKFKPYLYQYSSYFFYSLATLAISSLLVRNLGSVAYSQIIIMQSSALFVIQLIHNAIDLDFQRSFKNNSLQLFLNQKKVVSLFLLPLYVLFVYSQVDSGIISLGEITLFGLGVIFQSFVLISIAHKRAMGDDISSIIQRVLPQIIIVSSLLCSGFDLIKTYCISFFSSWLLVSIFSTKGFVSNLLTLTPNRSRFSFVRLLPLILSMLGTLFYGSLDIIVFSKETSPETISYFKIIYSMTFACSPLISATCFVMLSKLGTLDLALSIENIDKFTTSLLKNVILAFVVSIGWSALALFLFPKILVTSFDLNFNPYINTAMVLLLFTFTINSLSSILSYSLISLCKDNAVTASILFGGFIYMALLFYHSKSSSLDLQSFSLLALIGNLVTFFLLLLINFGIIKNMTTKVKPV